MKRITSALIATTLAVTGTAALELAGAGPALAATQSCASSHMASARASLASSLTVEKAKWQARVAVDQATVSTATYDLQVSNEYGDSAGARKAQAVLRVATPDLAAAKKFVSGVKSDQAALKSCSAGTLTAVSHHRTIRSLTALETNLAAEESANNAALSPAEYDLSVARSYGDTQGAANARAEIAGLKAEIASEKAQIAAVTAQIRRLS
jgi:hypothetical protein